MTIKGIEELRFGVEDVEKARRFLDDFGHKAEANDDQEADL